MTKSYTLSKNDDTYGRVFYGGVNLGGELYWVVDYRAAQVYSEAEMLEWAEVFPRAEFHPAISRKSAPVMDY